MQLTELARAKVNLNLHILGKRADGYHELVSDIRFASVGDLVTLEPADAFSIDAPGLAVPPADNLMLKAVTLFADRFGPQCYRITLDKRLPIAAGLGGGSADAAAVLRLLARAHGLNAAPDMKDAQGAIAGIAPMIGSDVPVCLVNMAARVSGRGEIVTPRLHVQPSPAVLVNTRAAVPPQKTAAVFRALGARPLAEVPPLDLALAHNQLERPALQVMPEIGEVLAALRGTTGVRFAQMSGAGPTCFGLYGADAEAAAAADAILRAHPTWWVQATTLS